jgi:hypothetical protein
MRIEKVDKIVSEFRDPVIRVKGLDKLWKQSLKNLKRINENNVYNYNHELLSGLTALSKSSQTHFLSQLSKSKDEMDVLRYGIYTKPGSSTFW